MVYLKGRSDVTRLSIPWAFVRRYGAGRQISCSSSPSSSAYVARKDRPMPTSTESSASELLRKIPPAVRPIVQAARRTVKAVAPTAEEISYQGQQPRSSSYMWKLVRYAVDGANVVGIGTFQRHSTLFFYRGRELDDGSGLLEGSGKDSRFITLRRPADAERPDVKRLVRKAFKLGG